MSFIKNIEDYANSLGGRLKHCASMTDAKPPKEVSVHFSYEAMQKVINSVWVSTPKERPFSPLIKQLAPGKIISVAEPLLPEERNLLKMLCTHLYAVYGDPVFKNEGELQGTRALAVKQWQSLALVSPKVTANSSKRRYDNLDKYLTGSKFSPNWKILYDAIEIFLELAKMPQVKVSFEPEYVKGLFAAHSSNVGYPYFANERNTYDGKSYREITVELTKKLNSLYGASWMPTIPALIIGRDQPGGIDLDLSQNWKYSELLSALDKVGYKPSKARVVWAISRIVNNNINPIVKAIINNEAFRKNPMFAAFQSREYREQYYKLYSKLTNEKKKIPINVDFSSFDTTISGEMMLIASDIVFSWLDLDNAPIDLKESIESAGIFTKYVTYNPYKNTIQVGMKRKAIPSGLGFTGIYGLILASISWIYGCLVIKGRDWLQSWIDACIQAGTFALIGLGDDLLAVVDNFSDLRKIADVIMDTFGMEISVDGIKTSVGVDFLQEYYDGKKISYPVGRAVRSALYTERPKGLGWAQWVMTWHSILYNLRTNDKSDYNWLALYIMTWDRSRLGFVDPKTNKEINKGEFMSRLKQELAEQNLTAKEALWDGDPSKETKFTDDFFDSTYLDIAWARVKPLYDSNFKGEKYDQNDNKVSDSTKETNS